MLGLAGETGQLPKRYKKHLRDGDAHRLFKSASAKSLAISCGRRQCRSKFDLSLDDIAALNLSRSKRGGRLSAVEH